ncbi:MAG: BRO family protein [Ruminococcaceae bacterium]|nr:BRO family protein [Oscillospiraceae bacterium]
MNELKVFSSTEFGELGVMLIDGKEYFPATQCAAILGHENPARAVRKYCKGVTKTVTPTNGGTQTVNYIPEGDLYRLIVSSKLPKAEEFEHWVFDTVLPQIRHNGGYIGNVEELIARTATAVVSEVIKQITPIIQRQSPYYDPLEDLRVASITAPTPRRKAEPGIIRRLDGEIRKRVDEMLLTDKYSYDDIKEYLARYGIAISSAAICRYRKSFYR